MTILQGVAKRSVLFGLLFSAVLIAACAQSSGPDEPTDRPAGNNEPTATRTPTPTPAPTEVPLYAELSIAPDFTLPSANSEPVTLSELSAEKPVVLVFYRAFW